MDSFGLASENDAENWLRHVRDGSGNTLLPATCNSDCGSTGIWEKDHVLGVT